MLLLEYFVLSLSVHDGDTQSRDDWILLSEAVNRLMPVLKRLYIRMLVDTTCDLDGEAGEEFSGMIQGLPIRSEVRVWISTLQSSARASVWWVDM
jgi:hypothetical protein